MNVTGGSTDVTTYFQLRNVADGTDATGKTITTFDLQYVRSGATPSTKADATALGAANSAHTDNAMIEVDATDSPGLYRVDWPDAAFAAGVREVILTVKQADIQTASLRVTIDSEVNVTKISGDQTAADNLELDYDGTGYNKSNSTVGTVSTLSGHTAQTGDSYARLGAPAGASVSADIAAIEAQTDDIGVAGAGLTNVPWNAAWDAQVESEVTDALNLYDPPTRAELTSDINSILAVTGSLADAAAAGDPTATDTLVAYLKQIINTLEGTAGVPTYPTEAPPGNGASLAEVIRAIHADVTGLNGDAMRGTDNALLASSAPTNFGDLAITVTTGQVTVGTNNDKTGYTASTVSDKTGYSISGTKTTLDALNDISTANVNAEVADVLKTDTITLPGQTAPPATPTFEQALSWLYKVFRNKTTQTGSLWELRNDADTATDAKATISDNGTTATIGEVVSGP